MPHVVKPLAMIAICVAACGRPVPVDAEPSGAAAEVGARTDAELVMPVARAAHSALAMSDGQVLLIGGCVRPSCETGPESAAVDLFDPRTNKFRWAGPLLNARTSTSVARIAGDRAFIAGGWSGAEVTGTTEIFDPRIGRSVATPSLSIARADIAVAVLRDGRVLLAGGYDGRGAVDAVEIFDPRDGSLHKIGALAIPRTGSGAALLPDGRVLVAGGGVNGANGLTATATAEIVDPAGGKSILTGNLREARYKHAVIALPNGQVLAIGGSDERDSRGKRNTIERYDPAQGRFVQAGRMGASRYKIANAVVLLDDGRVLIVGGAPQAEIYDPSTTRTVAVGPRFGGALNFMTATMLSDGGVLAAGGYFEEGIRMSRAAWLLDGESWRKPA